MKQLSGLDTLFLQTEMHGLPMHTSMLSIYDPSTSSKNSVEFKDILNLFEARTHSDMAFLRCKLMSVPMGLDQPYWLEDPHFDLVYHIRHIALPKPCNWQKLCSLVANMHAQPLNRNRPLWEVHIIDGLDHIENIPSGCFAIFFKVHHALMDGMTAMNIFNSLHEIMKKDSATLQAVEVNLDHFMAYESDMRLPQIAAKAALNNIYRVGNVIRMVGRAFGLYGAIMRGIESREIKQLHKHKTRFNGTISPRRVIDRVNLPLDAIYAIRAKVGDATTIGDIALSIIGGAMRRYLLAKDELPEDSLVAAVPLSVKKEEENNEQQTGNHKISIANISLRTDTKDSLERLQKVHTESQSGKAYAKTLGNNLVADAMNCLHTGLVAWGVRTAVESGVFEKFPPANNTVIANLAGASEQLFFCGAKMVDTFGMGPLIPNTGLFHTLSTTWQSLTIAFTADRQKMEDPAFYAQCIRESFDDLYSKACAEKTPVAKSPPSVKEVAGVAPATTVMDKTSTKRAARKATKS